MKGAKKGMKTPDATYYAIREQPTHLQHQLGQNSFLTLKMQQKKIFWVVKRPRVHNQIKKSRGLKWLVGENLDRSDL